MFDLFISSHPHILISLGSSAFACTLAFSHPYILMFECNCLYPHILTSSYPQVHLPSLVPCILVPSGSCVLACNLVSSHPLILRLTYSVYLLVSSHPHILISLDSCTLNTYQYLWILTYSYSQVSVLVHVQAIRIS